MRPQCPGEAPRKERLPGRKGLWSSKALDGEQQHAEGTKISPNRGLRLPIQSRSPPSNSAPSGLAASGPPQTLVQTLEGNKKAWSGSTGLLHLKAQEQQSARFDLCALHREQAGAGGWFRL